MEKHTAVAVILYISCCKFIFITNFWKTVRIGILNTQIADTQEYFVQTLSDIFC